MLNCELILSFVKLYGSHSSPPAIYLSRFMNQYGSTKVLPLPHPVTFLFSCFMLISKWYVIYSCPNVTLAVRKSFIMHKDTDKGLFLSVLIVIQVRSKVQHGVNAAIFIGVGDVVLREGLGDVLENVREVIVIADGIV